MENLPWRERARAPSARSPQSPAAFLPFQTAQDKLAYRAKEIPEALREGTSADDGPKWEGGALFYPGFPHDGAGSSNTAGRYTGWGRDVCAIASSLCGSARCSIQSNS